MHDDHYNNDAEFGEFLTKLDAALKQSIDNPRRRVAAWRLLLNTSDTNAYDELYPLMKMFLVHPQTAVGEVVAALCVLIDDPNAEDNVAKILPRFETAVLDNEACARACCPRPLFECYTRHSDVAIRAMSRMSTATLLNVLEPLHDGHQQLTGAISKRGKRRVDRIGELVQKARAHAGHD